ncbi:YrhK family protein [Halomarina litorea]|uniref:YrhK family protein n=1 Tax=Halomarina litorea TaxID=2961595 RepID=UPI0020C3D333|nr:YrhK family protein [Halomarina sp. BCD28]
MATQTSYSGQSLDGEAIRAYLDEHRWVHLSLGLLGNLLFFGGSVLFLFEGRLQTFGVWAFVVGSFLMLVRAVGEGLVTYVEREDDSGSTSG